MNSEQILQALRGKLDHKNVNFMGCLPADHVARLDLRNKGGKPIVFIANVLSTSEIHRMGHWVVYYIAGKCIHFFDSYAINPRLYSRHFLHFLNKHKEFTLLKLAFRLQSDQSLVCGAYCVQFTYLCDRLGIIKASEFLKNNYTVNDYVLNDRKVLKYVYDHFKMPPCTATFSKHGMTYKTCARLYSKHHHTPHRNIS